MIWKKKKGSNKPLRKEKKEKKKVGSSFFIWRNMKIRSKLFTLFGSLLVFFIVGFALVFFYVDTMEKELGDLTEKSNANLMAMEIGGLISTKYIYILDYDRNRRLNTNAYNENEAKLEQGFAIVSEAMATEEQQDLFNRIQENYNQFSDLAEQLLNAPAAATNEQMLEKIGEFSRLENLRNRIVMDLGDLTTIVSHQFVEAEEQVSAAVLSTKLVLGIALLTAIIIGAILIVLYSNSLTRTLKKVVDIAENISQGKLKVDTIVTRSNDEVGQLSRSMNEMADRLRSLVLGISASSEQVASAAEQLSASSNEAGEASEHILSSTQQVASGAEKQQHSTDEAYAVAETILSSMNEMNDTFTNVSTSSNETLRTANRGNEVINETVEQMQVISVKTKTTSEMVDQLGTKSSEIESIVSLITDVSEQTNLLALNAAIEAARAGEQGKGFAVVANEVRKLAEQTGMAAGKISSLIKTIQDDIKGSVASMEESNIAVERGRGLVEQAGSTFAEITNAVSSVTKQVGDVKQLVERVKEETDNLAVSINETKKIGEEATSYSQMVAESAEEQNASIEEIVAASQTLAEIAEELQNEIASFKLN